MDNNINKQNVITDLTVIEQNSTPYPFAKKSVEMTGAYKDCQKLLQNMLKESMHWNYKTLAGNWYSRMEDYMISCGAHIIEAYDIPNRAEKIRHLHQAIVCIEKTILIYRPLIEAFEIDENSTLILQVVRLKCQLESWYIHLTREKAQSQAIRNDNKEETQTVQ